MEANTSRNSMKPQTKLPNVHCSVKNVTFTWFDLKCGEIKMTCGKVPNGLGISANIKDGVNQPL